MDAPSRICNLSLRNDKLSPSQKRCSPPDQSILEAKSDDDDRFAIRFSVTLNRSHLEAIITGTITGQKGEFG